MEVGEKSEPNSAAPGGHHGRQQGGAARAELGRIVYAYFANFHKYRPVLAKPAFAG
jgi:hypothetical protein